jgi:isocitrate/isopropylmalate dehydrogenase
MASRVTLIPGDGIGPEITAATLQVLDGERLEMTVCGVVARRQVASGYEMGAVRP